MDRMHRINRMQKGDVLRETGMVCGRFDRELMLTTLRKKLESVERSMELLRGAGAKQVLEQLLTASEQGWVVEDDATPFGPF